MPLSAEPTVSASSPSRLVRDFMDAVWNAHDPAAATAFFDPAFVDHAYAPPDAAGHAGMLRAFTAAFSDTRHDVEQLTTDGDLVLLRTRVRGRHTGPFRDVPASGHAIDVVQYRSFRVAGGRIAEHWALFDTPTLLRQIGAPPEAMAACRLPAAR